ncbi:hypothetical protein P689_12251 [Candidatus Riesia pediculischaeffi PTSU]|uniref:Uncharacterized protein n=1 Tax=Candidatus Riesia pediculischaeffi PTSU TaxID=1401651 RepID=A0A0C1S000_9ENTR|nr:hypothetical protein P689_12251 [Candidatus Riesia pediculischaeffi PTSU]
MIHKFLPICKIFQIIRIVLTTMDVMFYAMDFFMNRNRLYLTNYFFIRFSR